MENRITLALPPEFLELCQQDRIDPETVLRGFVADLCELRSYVANPRPDGYSSHGSDEQTAARAYYERVGYPFTRHTRPELPATATQGQPKDKPSP